jgi:hypothetical protein
MWACAGGAGCQALDDAERALAAEIALGLAHAGLVLALGALSACILGTFSSGILALVALLARCVPIIGVLAWKWGMIWMHRGWRYGDYARFAPGMHRLQRVF